VRAYELMYILSPNLEEEAIADLVARFEGIITSGGGEIEKTEQLGKRRLAYEIQGYQEGFYVLTNFKSPVETAQELDRIIKITDNVLRYLIIKIEE
jgi:small subunit ribosomal protein S6